MTPCPAVESRIANAGQYPVYPVRLPSAPGTSKWNKIEHAFFLHYVNGAKTPAELQDHCSVIAATTTNAGLTVRANWTRTNIQGSQNLRRQIRAVNLTATHTR